MIRHTTLFQILLLLNSITAIGMFKERILGSIYDELGNKIDNPTSEQENAYLKRLNQMQMQKKQSQIDSGIDLSVHDQNPTNQLKQAQNNPLSHKKSILNQSQEDSMHLDSLHDQSLINGNSQIDIQNRPSQIQNPINSQVDLGEINQHGKKLNKGSLIESPSKKVIIQNSDLDNSIIANSSSKIIPNTNQSQKFNAFGSNGSQSSQEDPALINQMKNGLKKKINRSSNKDGAVDPLELEAYLQKQRLNDPLNKQKNIPDKLINPNEIQSKLQDKFKNKIVNPLMKKKQTMESGINSLAESRQNSIKSQISTTSGQGKLFQAQKNINVSNLDSQIQSQKGSHMDSFDLTEEDLKNNLKDKMNQQIHKMFQTQKKKLNSMQKGVTHIQAKNSFLNSSEEDVPQCNLHLLGAFNVPIDSDTAREATFAERQYCNRNQYTCCSSADIEATKNNYLLKVKELEQRMELIEEMLTLFTGQAYKQVIFEVKNNDKCDNVFTRENINKNTFLSDEEINKAIDNLQTLRIKLKSYTYKQKAFYKNMICTICNPFNHQFFNIANGGSSVIVHSTLCVDMFENKDFEVELVLAYKYFIEPFSKLTDCTQNTIVTYDVVDLDPILEQHENVHKCFKEHFDVHTENCKDLCWKNIVEYKFPIPILNNFVKSLKGIFNKLTKGDITEYYTIVKNKHFPDHDNDAPIVFYASHGITENKIGELEWEIENDNGISTYHDKMHKKYLKSSGVVIMITSSILMLLQIA